MQLQHAYIYAAGLLCIWKIQISLNLNYQGFEASISLT